ncbi:DUF3108 domain-containing protein [bacterium]|nr:DUF3108 domain-containing protein [bacterium]
MKLLYIPALIIMLYTKPCIQDTTVRVITDTTDTAAVVSHSDSINSDILSLQDTLAVEADTAFSVPDSVKMINEAFGIGEDLVFDIGYGIIKAGTATMSIPDTERVKGRLCFHIITTANSNKFISAFFKVRDSVETFIDTEGLFPWKFVKKIREGRYRSEKYVEYDQVNHVVIENKRDTLRVGSFIQGVLSSFYYTRLMELKPGIYFDIDNYGDGKLYPLRVFVRKRQKVKVPAGTFKCIVVEPVMRVEGIFKQKGKLTIWLTDDESRMPVLMKSKALIGSVSVKLRKFKRGKIFKNRERAE